MTPPRGERRPLPPLPHGFSVPRGLRRVGGRVYLDGTRIYPSDELEIELDGGRWERGHYWHGPGAPWAQFVSAVRWFCYIIGPATVLRRVSRRW
jgi:hypothetical protein